MPAIEIFGWTAANGIASEVKGMCSSPHGFSSRESGADTHHHSNFFTRQTAP
jgi:hypothetical protein